MLDYNDRDGFRVMIHRAESETGEKLIDVIVSNPPKDGWSSGANAQIPERVFVEAIKEMNPGVEEIMKIVCDWYVAVNDGAGYDGGDLVADLERAGYKLPECDDDE